MTKFLMDTGNRITGWLVTTASGVTLWVDDIFHQLDEIGKFVITIFGVLAGLFIFLSYLYQYKIKRREYKEKKKE